MDLETKEATLCYGFVITDGKLHDELFAKSPDKDFKTLVMERARSIQSGTKEKEIRVLPSMEI